jgi:hypothetical protein
MPPKNEVMVFPAEFHGQMLFGVWLSKYCSRTTFPSLSTINALVSFESRNAYKSEIALEHHWSDWGFKVSHVVPELGGKYRLWADALSHILVDAAIANKYLIRPLRRTKLIIV